MACGFPPTFPGQPPIARMSSSGVVRSMTAVAPVWEGITIIPDEVTLAKKGQLVITAVMLYAMKVFKERRWPREARNRPRLEAG